MCSQIRPGLLEGDQNECQLQLCFPLPSHTFIWCSNNHGIQRWCRSRSMLQSRGTGRISVCYFDRVYYWLPELEWRSRFQRHASIAQLDQKASFYQIRIQVLPFWQTLRCRYWLQGSLRKQYRTQWALHHLSFRARPSHQIWYATIHPFYLICTLTRSGWWLDYLCSPGQWEN